MNSLLSIISHYIEIEIECQKSRGIRIDLRKLINLDLSNKYVAFDN